MARRPMKAMKAKRKTSVRRKRKSSAGSRPRRVRQRTAARRDLRLQDVKNHHDAFNKHKPLFVPNQTANFVTINGIIRLDVNSVVNTTNNLTRELIIVAMWTPNQKTRLIAFNSDGAFQASDTTAFGSSASENPIVIRPLRQSLRIRCTTKATDVAGTLRIIPGDDLPLLGLASTTQLADGATWTRWKNYVVSDRKAHSMSASELRTTHRWVMRPGQSIPFQSYHAFYGPDATFADYTTLFEFARKQEPLSALVFYIPSTSTAQNFEFTLHFQDAAQFSPGTIVQQQAAPPPTGNPDLHARAQAMLAMTAHQGDMEL